MGRPEQPVRLFVVYIGAAGVPNTELTERVGAD